MCWAHLRAPLPARVSAETLRALGRNQSAGRPCIFGGVVTTCNRMVVDQLEREQADRVFHALADGTRRDILLHTLDGPHNVSALARRYPMSFAAVQKHVAVLEGAGLVIKQRQGREQLVRGNVETMRQASRLLEQLEAVWTGRIERIGELLADEQNQGANA